MRAPAGPASRPWPHRVPARPARSTGTVSVAREGRPPGQRTSPTSVVWVDGVKARAQGRHGRRMTMRAKSFTPHVVVVAAWAAPWSSRTRTRSSTTPSRSSGENRFDLELYKRPKSGSWTFEAPGIVRVYCNIHPQMSAIVVVRDNPYFTKAGADGSFAIEGVPAGQVHAEGLARARRRSEPRHQRARRGTGRARNSTLDASNYKRAQHKNKFGKDYSARARQVLNGTHPEDPAASRACSSSRWWRPRLSYTTFQADQLAHQTITQALAETRGRLGDLPGRPLQQAEARACACSATTRPSRRRSRPDQATVFDMLQERGKDLGADFFIATDPRASSIARSDRPAARARTSRRTPW